MRAGALQTAFAALLAAATGALIIATTGAQDHRVFATQLVLFAVASFISFLVLGATRLLGWTSVFMLGSAAIEAGFGDGPSWIRSLAVGCLWYVAVEVGWDAIERRDGAEHSPAANRRRIQELSVVVAVSLAVGLVAIVAASFAPVRSVALQATVLAVMLGVMTMTVRHLSTTTTSRGSS